MTLYPHSCPQTYIFLLIFSLLSPLLAFSQEQAPDSVLVYIVQPGDNLYRIAQKYLPYTDILTLPEFISAIKDCNHILENNIIFPGQNLEIPVTWDKPLPPLRRVNHETVRGIYLNTYQLSTTRLTEIIEHYDSLGCNTLVIDFKNENGEILYPTAHPLAKEIGACNPIIGSPQKLIYLLHKHNIMVVARLTMFRDPKLAQAKPEWTPQFIPVHLQNTAEENVDYPDTTNNYCILKDSLSYVSMDSLFLPDTNWVNPALPEVKQYNLEIIKEVAELGVDEIQLDYVRFPTETHLLTADYNITDSIPKHQIIVDFLKSAQSITKDAGITLSADIFGVVALQNPQDIINTGQIIELFMPYIDRLHPMIYPSHFFGRFWGRQNPEQEPYYFTYRTCKKIGEIITEPEKIAPFLQAFSLNISNLTPLYIISQLQALADANVKGGYLFWNAYGNYDAVWEALYLWNNDISFYQLFPK